MSATKDPCAVVCPEDNEANVEAVLKDAPGDQGSFLLLVESLLLLLTLGRALLCLGLWECRPLINEPPPLNRDYNRGPNIKALKRRVYQSGAYITALFRVRHAYETLVLCRRTIIRRYLVLPDYIFGFSLPRFRGCLGRSR